MINTDTITHWQVVKLAHVINDTLGKIPLEGLHLRSEGLLDELQEELENIDSALIRTEDDLETAQADLDHAEERTTRLELLLEDVNLEGLLTRREYEDLQEHAYQLRQRSQTYLSDILDKILTQPLITQ